MAIHLGEDSIEALTPYPELVENLGDAFRDWAHGNAGNHSRQRFFLPTCVLHHMAAHWDARQVAGIKTYTSSRNGNRFRMELFSTGNGDLIATLDALLLGQRRTGAATALAAKHMAAPDPKEAAILGSGFQAAAQLEALVATLPSLRRIRVWSRTPDNASTFAMAQTLRLGIAVDAVESAEDAVRNVPIVACATTSREPILRGAWLAPGAFVAAAGANRLTAREIDEETIARAAVVAVDDPAQAPAEAAELHATHERLRFPWSRIVPFADIVAGFRPGRPQDSDAPVVFKSLGIALEDIAAAELALRKAGHLPTAAKP